ncbi:MAG: hypothetical protein GFH27_549287n414 [Chloroflexi bacterium AL-W]|nr:hypothetical protein [Chloroflexi bacterium AL-N1]NOK66688.1 hypothetical protein [Chloroflexi bacterium AL-N10]NOK72076.1 hypothetical protein [Chloroflexi bacterium AL-N5]NOK81333.1 hypothetical protein [Chloroflexi bacterium AL-W]NOK89606.1 hypothetical protein [Chloroflexi bacterium AL-N15]
MRVKRLKQPQTQSRHHREKTVVGTASRYHRSMGALPGTRPRWAAFAPKLVVSHAPCTTKIRSTAAIDKLRRPSIARTLGLHNALQSRRCTIPLGVAAGGSAYQIMTNEQIPAPSRIQKIGAEAPGNCTTCIKGAMPDSAAQRMPRMSRKYQVPKHAAHRVFVRLRRLAPPAGRVLPLVQSSHTQ